MMRRYVKLGAAEEVKPLWQLSSDLPRGALIKVASHLFKGRRDSSSKEGFGPCQQFQFIHTFIDRSYSLDLNLNRSSTGCAFNTRSFSIQPRCAVATP